MNATVISWQIANELNDLRQQGVTLGQLGTLAMQEDDLGDAVKRYREASERFQRLGEPAMQAVAQHQLGMAFQRAQQWEQAEHHYREAARLDEQQGNLADAAPTWNQLAEEALKIKRTLDPGAAEIWTTYRILAQIADRQSQPQRAAEYRRLAREAKRNFAGTAHEMQRFDPLIRAVVQAAQDPAAPAALESGLLQMEQAGWTNRVPAIRRILAGERNADELCEPLDFNAAWSLTRWATWRSNRRRSGCSLRSCKSRTTPARP